jgi:hypothetical protein
MAGRLDWQDPEDIKYTEELIHKEFEKWTKEGSKYYMYNLATVANGEYVSVYTEQAFKAFKAGFDLVNEAWGQQEGVGYSHYN